MRSNLQPSGWRIYVFVLVCVLATSAQAQTTLRSTLLLRYQAFTKAIQSNDTAFLDTYFAPDFTADLLETHADRAAALKGLGDLMLDARHLNWTWEISDVKLLPEGPTVTAKGVMTARMKGPDSKWHRVKIAGTADDTWILNQNVWQQRHMRMTEIAAWVDGKPLPKPAGPFTP